MKTTVDEMLAMGKEGFLDAMLAGLEAKARWPDLSPEEKGRLLRRAQRVRAQLAERREHEAVQPHDA